MARTIAGEHNTCGTSRDHTTSGASRDHTTSGASRDHTTSGASRDHTMSGAFRDHSTSGASRDHTTSGASRDYNTSIYLYISFSKTCLRERPLCLLKVPRLWGGLNESTNSLDICCSILLWQPKWAELSGMLS